MNQATTLGGPINCVNCQGTGKMPYEDRQCVVCRGVCVVGWQVIDESARFLVDETPCPICGAFKSE